MILGIMQPYLFPYLGYFQLIEAVDKFIIYDDVNYIVRGWINRNQILHLNQPFLFTLPLKKASRNKRINEIVISETYIEWKTKFMRTLSNNYSKAPYFDDCLAIIETILSCNTTNLSQFIQNSLKLICNYLHISTRFIESSSKYSNQNMKGQNRIIDICKYEGAATYINLFGGKTLYSDLIFNQNLINLYFLKSNIVEYTQFTKHFIPNLSIIDTMMFNSVVDIRSMLKKCILIK